MNDTWRDLYTGCGFDIYKGNNMITILQQKAELYRDLYRKGECSREEAILNIQPYLNFVNEKAKEISKKYNIKSRKVNFSGYVR
jgi:hypothetical protein